MKARQRLVALQAAQQGCNHLRWLAGATTRTRRCRQCWVLNAVARLATRLTPPTRHALPRRRHFEANRSLHRTYRERIAVWGRLDCVRLPRNALRRWAVEVIDLDPADVDDGARRQPRRSGYYRTVLRSWGVRHPTPVARRCVIDRKRSAVCALGSFGNRCWC